MLESSLVFCTLLGPEGPAGIREDAVTDLWTSSPHGDGLRTLV